MLVALYSFRDPLARFFGSGREGVPVLIEADEQKRLARLALLHRVFSLFNWYADFTRISTR
jgi:glycyl-tRNA synthetase beta subunit